MSDTQGGVRTAMRQGLLALGGLACFVGLVAGLAPVGGAVVAPGRLRPDGERIAVSHLEGGIVRRLGVEEGKLVAAGDVLVELDPTQLQAEIEILRDRQLRLRFETARLRAEEALAAAEPAGPTTSTVGSVQVEPPAIFPEELQELARRSEPVRLVLKLQEETLAAKRAAVLAELGSLAEAVTMAQHEARGLGRQAAALVDQLAVIESEQNDLVPLVDKGYVPKRRLLDLMRTAAELRGDLAAVETRRDGALDRERQARLEAGQVRERMRNEALRELGRAQAELAEIEQRLVAVRDRASRLVVRAPQAGQVVELKLSSKGDVLAPGAQLLELVPEGRELTVVARVSPTDVEQITAGQDVEVRLSAFDNRRFSPVPGRIQHVSRDAVADPRSGQQFFPVHVRFAGSLPEGVSSGMPAEVYFKTGERSLASYLLAPLLNSMERSLREP